MFEWHDLNARHEAILIWLCLVIVFAVVKSSDVRRSLGHFAKTIVSPFVSLSILGLLLNAGGLATGIVILGRMVGFWETLPIVATVVWSFTSGLALLMNIEGFFKNDNEFRSKAVATLAPATIASEVLGNAVFPLWIELGVMPLIVLFIFGAYARESENEKQVYRWLLSIYGLILLAWLIFGLIKEPDSWESVAQSLIFPLIMTVGVFPFLKSLILFESCRFLVGVKSKRVRAEAYGDEWPLTVPEAKLCCKHGAVWVEVSRKRYRINGWSEPLLKQRCISIHELDPIWRDHPERAEIVSKLGADGETFVWKVDVGRLLDDGRALEGTEN